jgi:hypothetical protein
METRVGAVEKRQSYLERDLRTQTNRIDALESRPVVPAAVQPAAALTPLERDRLKLQATALELSAVERLERLKTMFGAGVVAADTLRTERSAAVAEILEALRVQEATGRPDRSRVDHLQKAAKALLESSSSLSEPIEDALRSLR